MSDDKSIPGVGRRGPAKKPPHLKIVSGTVRGDRVDPEVVTLSDGVDPVPPKHLTKAERETWETTIAALRPIGLLSSVDVFLLAAYCICVSTEKAAAKIIATEGLLSSTQAGLPATHPAVTIRRQAMVDGVAYAGHLGMTPAARLRLNAQAAPEKKKNPFMELKNQIDD